MNDIVQVPRATLEYWLANVCDEPVSYVSGMRLDMQRILLEADDLSTEPPNVDTSGERVDDVDTFPEDSVNDPGCIEASPENVTHGWARGVLDLRGSVDPREGMADLHGTTTADDLCLLTADQIEAAGFVRKEELDKAINALRAELMPEIRRAQYPKVNYTVDHHDAE